MKVGSIVVVKPIPIGGPLASFVKWLPIQDEKTPYMVRRYEDNAVTLEEGVVGMLGGEELLIKEEYVKEVLPPEDLTEFIEECCCVPMEKY